MAIFPRIQSPCPYLNRLSTLMDGDMCRMCERQVVDLAAMSDSERAAFMTGCSGKVCVQYQFAARPVVAAAMVAAAIAAPTAAAACEATEVMVIMGGGISDPAHVYYDPSADAGVPQLPVVFETTQSGETTQSIPAPSSARAGS